MYSTDINDTRPLPAELQSAIGTEKILFTAISKRNKHATQTMVLLCGGGIFSVLAGIPFIGFFYAVSAGEKVNFTVNNASKTADLGNLLPILFPIIAFIVILLPGMIICGWGLYHFLQKGGHYVATKSRLLRYHKGTIYSYDWGQFLDSAEVNIKKGTLLLTLRTGKEGKGKHSPQCIPDTLYLSGLPNPLEIAKICHDHIAAATAPPQFPAQTTPPTPPFPL